ncbi:MAG TPA: phage major capsid protein [Puia sp.]
MKRTHISFPASGSRGFAPKISSRRLGHQPFMNIAYRSDGGEEGDAKQALLDAIKKQVGDELSTRGYQSKADLDNAIAAQMKPFEGIDLEGLRSLSEASKANGGIMEVLRAQGEKIAELEKRSTGGEGRDLSIRGQVQAWQERNKGALEKIKNGQKADLEPLEIRAPATMTLGTSLNSSAYLPNPQGQPGIVDLVRVQPTFWNQLSKGATRANPFYWVNKTNKEGNAQFIGEGVLKPLASFQLETETSVPKKVAERMKISTEMLYDLDAMASYMEAELRYEVETAANAAVLTGVLSSTSPAGITTIASAFNLTTISTTNPTTADVVRASIAQIRSLNFNGVITAYMNPIDVANMDLEKATDSGVYMLPPFTSADNTVVKGVRIIEDNNIAVGYLLIGVMDLYKILIHEAFKIMWGWENDDFSKNLVTVIGEMRFHQFYSSNHTGAWIYDTIANIKAAISGGNE